MKDEDTVFLKPIVPIHLSSACFMGASGLLYHDCDTHCLPSSPSPCLTPLLPDNWSPLHRSDPESPPRRGLCCGCGRANEAFLSSFSPQTAAARPPLLAGTLYRCSPGSAGSFLGELADKIGEQGVKNEVTMSGYQRAVLETLPYLAMLELSSTVSGRKVQIALHRTAEARR